MSALLPYKVIYYCLISLNLNSYVSILLARECPWFVKHLTTRVISHTTISNCSSRIYYGYISCFSSTSSAPRSICRLISRASSCNSSNKQSFSTDNLHLGLKSQFIHYYNPSFLFSISSKSII